MEVARWLGRFFKWFKQEPDAVEGRGLVGFDDSTVDAERLMAIHEKVREATVVETMELVKPIRTGKPQNYGEIQRQRSRRRHPRRH